MNNTKTDTWAWIDGKWVNVIEREQESGTGIWVVESYEQPAKWYRVPVDNIRRGDKPTATVNDGAPTLDEALQEIEIAIRRLIGGGDWLLMPNNRGQIAINEGRTGAVGIGDDLPTALIELAKRLKDKRGVR